MSHEAWKLGRRTRIAACVAIIACNPDQADLTAVPGDARAVNAVSMSVQPGVHRQYGVPVTLGDGKVRTYVVLDAKEAQEPIEVGVAIDARLMEGALPSGPEPIMLMLALPPQAPVPYRFVMFDWNPQGHPLAGVFDLPHFDFHFYIVPQADVESIRLDDPEFAAKGNNLPTGDFVPPMYVVGKPPNLPPAAVAIPGMGVHWQDLLSPEYQRILGRPEAYRPFTKTYVYVSWDGRFTALEPMITREYLLRRIDETVPVREPARYPTPGWYPSAYRIEYDDRLAEYRVALANFTWRDGERTK